MRYPYFLAPGDPKGASVPLVKIVYKHGSKQTSPVLALVDSGASVSFAPLDIALWLGIRVDKKKSLDLRGFNNSVTTCYPGIVTVVVNSWEVEMRVYFGGPPTLQCILGQDPFFDKAKITFERYDSSFSIDWVDKKVKN